MPPRTTASPKQREIFAALSAAKYLVFAMKNRAEHESVSINAHGRFYLFDKCWLNAKDNKHETLIAFSDTEGIDLTPTSEPVVHFHVDWFQIQWVIACEREPLLIGADKEIVFCSERNPQSRLFWFYFHEWKDIVVYDNCFGREWIGLS